MNSTTNLLTMSVLALAVMTRDVNGFSPTEPMLLTSHAASASTLLHAWSMPVPTFTSQSFASFSGPSWYNDIANPAARRTVYTDSPKEYNFGSPGNDWPSSFGAVEEAKEQEPGPLRPIRRVAQWARNRGLSGNNSA